MLVLFHKSFGCPSKLNVNFNELNFNVFTESFTHLIASASLGIAQQCYSDIISLLRLIVAQAQAEHRIDARIITEKSSFSAKLSLDCHSIAAVSLYNRPMCTERELLSRCCL